MLVMRKFKTTVPALVLQPRKEQLQIKGLPYEREWVESATIDDLDANLLATVTQHFPQTSSTAQRLLQLGLATEEKGGLQISRAALWLFAAEIERWHPRSHVRVIKIDGTEPLTGEQYNIVRDEFVEDNVVRLFDRGWDMLQQHLIQDAAMSDRHLTYPADACRLALGMALLQKDYSLNKGIEVLLFNDRISFKSPGKVPVGMATDTLELVNLGVPRNETLAKAMEKCQLIAPFSTIGSSVVTALTKQEFPAAQLSANGVELALTFFSKCEFTGEQLAYLKQFDRYELTNFEKKVLIAGRNRKELSPFDIYKALNTTERSVYQKVVAALKNAGLLTQFRTKEQARSIAFQQQMDKEQVPRFSVLTAVEA
jgi:ATP-dependent DNA helicase RecG